LLLNLQNTNNCGIIKLVGGNKVIGKIVKYFRYINDISIKELSDITGVSVTYISEIEKGKKNNISIDILTKLSKGFNISSSILMEIIEMCEEKNISNKVLILYILKLYFEKDYKCDKELVNDELVQKLLK